jgi:5,10-methylene-tetrahydrofolate dehydrogenase/methenyl tetrahydrofolate cyclohydrolase
VKSTSPEADPACTDPNALRRAYHPGGLGDIELGPISQSSSAYTPVPGGVGPMTINTLILQCVMAAEKKLSK